MNDRRLSRRRRLPFVRSGVLESAGRNHIVQVADLCPEGAFLSTRLAVEVGEKAVLRMVLPRDGREVPLPCQIVWRSEGAEARGHATAGLAVRFQGLDAAVARRVEEFAAEGLRPDPDPAPSERFEYRVIEVAELDEAELARLGLDGWRLSSALPAAQGLRLILLRRL
ncbi:MAG: PilZ domain-containing protein [Vicinamibacteria bacterium]